MMDDADDGTKISESAPTVEEVTPTVPGLNAYDTTAPDVYANQSRIIVGAADVSILFGLEIDPLFPQPIKPLVRIVLSHDNFIRMMQDWNRRVQFLEEAYKGEPKSLNDLFERDPDSLRRAFDRLIKGEAS